MNTRRAILARAERTKCQYPKQQFTTANLALCGDIRAEAAFIDSIKPRRSFWQRIKAAWRALK